MNHLKPILIITLLTGLSLALPAQSDNARYNSATIIWQGFDYEWKYDNHRYKRMGSYVAAPINDTPDNYETEIVNTAASGIGADVMNYSTYFTKVKAKDVFFDTQDSIDIHLVACERKQQTKNDKPGITFSGVFDFTFPLAENMKKLDNYSVILNGFDLYHARHKTGQSRHPLNSAIFDLWSEALKFSEMDIRIANLYIEREEGYYTVSIAVALTADCKTAECSKMNKACLDYHFKIPFTLVGGNTDALYLTSPSILSNEYPWEDEARTGDFEKRKSKRKNYYARRYDPNEISPKSKTVNFTVGTPDVQYMIPAITGFGFETNTDNRRLNKNENAYHLAAMNIAITPREGQGGGHAAYAYNYRLFFKQWLTDMRFFAHANPGSVRMDMRIIPLQFLNPVEVTTDKTTGQMKWKTNPIVPLSAESEKAIKRNRVTFKDN